MLAYKDIFLDINCIIDVKNLTGKIKVWVRFRIPFYAFQLVAFLVVFALPLGLLPAGVHLRAIFGIDDLYQRR